MEKLIEDQLYLEQGLLCWETLKSTPENVVNGVYRKNAEQIAKMGKIGYYHYDNRCDHEVYVFISNQPITFEVEVEILNGNRRLGDTYITTQKRKVEIK